MEKRTWQTMYFSVLILAIRPPKEEQKTEVSVKTTIRAALLLGMQLGVAQSGNSVVVVQAYTLFS